MGIYYSSLLVVFAVVCFMMLVDKNVGEYFLLKLQHLRSYMLKLWWVIRNHPTIYSNFIGTRITKIKYYFIARSLYKNLNQTLKNEL